MIKVVNDVNKSYEIKVLEDCLIILGKAEDINFQLYCIKFE